MKPEKDKSKAAPASAAKKSGAPNGRVFDVSRPGKAPASPTSRPVIMGHKPEAQQAQAAVSGVGEARPLLTSRKIQIMPIGESEDSVNVEPKKPEEKPAEKPAETSAPEQKPARKLLSAEPTEEEKDALGVAALDAVAGPPPVAAKTPPSAANGSKRIIQPLSLQKAEPKPEDESKAKTEAAPESTPEAEEPKEGEGQKSEPKLSSGEVPAESSSMPEAEPVKESALQNGQTEEEAPPEPVIEPLFDDSGAIVVSKHDYHRSRTGLKVFGVILLIILLAAAALDIALDLDLLKLENIPHTDYL